MIKALFFDIDGTLVDFATGRIPDDVLDGLYQLKEKGYKLCLASGRPPAHLSKMTEQLREFPWDGMVLFNGQYCVDEKKEVVSERKIPVSSLQALIPYVLQHTDTPTLFFTLNHSYTLAQNETFNEGMRKAGLSNMIPLPITEEELLQKDIYQMNAYIPEEKDAEFVSQTKGIKSARWTPMFADMIPAEGGKPEGIKILLERFGIQPEECMAFGDGGNDITMLEFAGIGVAMGNANEQVKSHADYVTEACADSGLLKAFQHFELL